MISLFTLCSRISISQIQKFVNPGWIIFWSSSIQPAFSPKKSKKHPLQVLLYMLVRSNKKHTRRTDVYQSLSLSEKDLAGDGYGIR